MVKYLQNQIHMYSLDTACFYNQSEKSVSDRIFKCRIHKKNVANNSNLSDKRINDHIHYINKRIEKLKNILNDTLNRNKDTRVLDPSSLKDTRLISVFESNLTRTLDIKIDDITEELFVVRVYYFQVLYDLIKNGFYYNGEKYIYFSSSAGQIRTKKGVWIKESSWLKHQKSLTCGLTVDEINKKGGSNINKYLAYIALTNSASQRMKNFDINKTIVVNDLETNVNEYVDYIDRDTYEITRTKMDIPIEHTDGVGMILPSLSNKSFMVRLPFVKGLLVPFDFRKFIKEKNGSPIVEDIYGNKIDVIKEDIQIIFTKSQFKMHKYYDGWGDYKERFKKYNCQASMLNEEEDYFSEAKLNYQMLQTLTSITDEELEEICESTNNDIREIGSDKETMLRVLGATKENSRKNYFQEALLIYPELLNDTHARKVIKDVKKSLVKHAKAGRINVDSKYSFVSPDFYAFCEYLFLGNENPSGLLRNGQIYFNQYDTGDIDLLRSPHLYREHAVRNNVTSSEMNKWFVTSNIYVSVHDAISKILQLDWDGDKLLAVNDQTIINVAKRDMEDIVPLYYKMEKAPPSEICYENIYNSLILAFKANIGVVSNDITKIWNSGKVDLDVIKWKTMENNFIIDYAKTLFMPTRPNDVDKKIKDYSNVKLPHFFIHAKDKDKANVNEVNNSVVNRLDYIIENKPIQFRVVAGSFNYWNLTSKKKRDLDGHIIGEYEKIMFSKKSIISNMLSDNMEERIVYFNNYLRQRLLDINPNINDVVDSLVHYLYKTTKYRMRSQLWDSFGDILVKNLSINLKNTKQCEECGARFKYSNNKAKYCPKCAKKIKNEQNKRYYYLGK
ncbi:hypothetical protein [Paraliobacillus ryukyuensis]|uniref:hypothetical protein n=1 Tax=Paraliobacillus ryukyuensis TaxID=200904 RepID=UPI002117EA6C|nr:hypothetical protein [Paraliobacillus ryukyuensis]